MIIFIKNELEKYLADKNFRGHIKVGIEKSNIVSLSVNSRCENKNVKLDYGEIVKKMESLFSKNDFYGSLEFDIECGELVQFNWSMSCNGADLRRRIDASLS